MDAIGGGNFEQDAWLTLDWANAKKTSDDVPNVPIKNGLKELLSIEKTAIQRHTMKLKKFIKMILPLKRN